MVSDAGLALVYAFVPSNNPILASVAGANPVTLGVQVIVSLPGINPVAITHATIEIPVGQNISGDLSTATLLPNPTYDQTTAWTIATSANTVTIRPKVGTSALVTSPIIVTLPGIVVNETPGTVPITITEYYPGAPKVVDDQSYSLLKQPGSFPITSFSVVPATVNSRDQYVTLQWTCSTAGQQDSFGLQVVGISADARSP